MGKVMFMRKGDVHTKPSVGVPAGDLAVGSSIYLNENGVPAEYLVVNVGIPSDSSLYDASCDGVWLLRKDLYVARQWNSTNSNNYSTSTIHTYLNDTFLNLFGTNIKAQIKQVKIPFVNGTGGSIVASGTNGLSAKIFLLSGYEVGWTTATNSYFPIDGASLSYFNGTSDSDSKRIAYLNNTATGWFLRSPYNGNTMSAWIVTSGGSRDATGVSGTGYAIRPALILPYDMKIDESMIVGGVS